MIRFVFDLDGTICGEEILLLIAAHFGIQKEISKLTQEIIDGNIPFVESIIKSIHILSDIPASKVDQLLGQVRLYPAILDFMQKHRENCSIVTGNLSCWVDTLLKHIGVDSHCSSALVEDGKVIKIINILQKEDIVKTFKEQGDTVVFIGESNSDVEAMRMADISVASALTRTPGNSVLSVADYLVLEEGALCRLLNQLF